MSRPLAALLFLLAATTLAGCSRSPRDSAPTPSASVARTPSAQAVPSAAASVPHLGSIPEAAVLRALNPKGLPVYEGPTGTVRGVIRVSGDTAPEFPEVSARIKPECGAARSVYGRLFREGADRTLGDVFVGVTGYPHFVPPREQFVTLAARDCAFERRTVGTTFGQGLRVQAHGTQSYIPALVGGLEGANMVALPNGSPVTLSPAKPGRHAVVDLMRPYVKADLFVVQYRTFDVTDVDGRYEVNGVPVGQVKVSALLPAAMIASESTVTVVADRPAEVDLTLTFDKKAYQSSSAAAASAKPSASGAPRVTASARPR